MAAQDERITKIYNGKPSYVYPPKMIKDIVLEIESGQLTIAQAMTKYEIRTKVTIKSWIIRYAKDAAFLSRIKAFSSAERRLVVMEIESGKITFREAQRKYNIGDNGLRQWIRNYSSDISVNKRRNIMKKELIQTENRDQNAIKELKLKIAALETMIDVAEKEFSIEIRKKSGTKQ